MPEEVGDGPLEQSQQRELPEGWDAATSYHKLKRQLSPEQRTIARERAIQAILDRAYALLRHAARPTRRVEDGFPAEGELDLDATLERVRPWSPQDLRVERVQPREADVIAILDMSLSMTGPKIALTALATAILRLRLDHVAVVHFDTKAHKLVGINEPVSPRELVRRVLEVPAQGYTNIEAGLKRSWRELSRGHRRERVGILMSDGMANMGADPARAAQRFPVLHIVQVGSEEKLGTETCRRMAEAGHGRVYRAPTYEELPVVVRRLVRDVFRGAAASPLRGLCVPSPRSDRSQRRRAPSSASYGIAGRGPGTSTLPCSKPTGITPIGLPTAWPPRGSTQTRSRSSGGKALPYGGLYQGIIISGSASGVRDEAPWMPILGRWALAMAAHTPVLAICFGHQLVGEALGGRVEANPKGPEWGTVDVALNDAGRADPLFTDLPDVLRVQALHRDVVLTEPEPHRFTRLAGNDSTPLQAFAVGPWLRAVQFHPELSARAPHGHSRHARLDPHRPRDEQRPRCNDPAQLGPPLRETGRVCRLTRVRAPPSD